MAFPAEILRRLQAQGVGTMGTTLFASSRSAVPSGSGPLLTLVETIGGPGSRTHNELGVAYREPSAQIVCRAENPGLARNMAHAAQSALTGIRNTVLGAFSGSITSLTRVGATATVITAVPHYLETGQQVTIAGANQTDYNGTFTITVLTPSSFTYTVAGVPSSPATGTMTLSFAGTRYLEVETAQEIFDLGPDGNGRARFAFNLTTVKEPS